MSAIAAPALPWRLCPRRQAVRRLRAFLIRLSKNLSGTFYHNEMDTATLSIMRRAAENARRCGRAFDRTGIRAQYRTSSVQQKAAVSVRYRASLPCRRDCLDVIRQIYLRFCTIWLSVCSVLLRMSTSVAVRFAALVLPVVVITVVPPDTFSRSVSLSTPLVVSEALPLSSVLVRRF